MGNSLYYYIIKFNKIRNCIFCALFFIPFFTLAQTRGSLVVVKSPLVDTLIARRPTLGKTINTIGDEGSSGYRVQIFFGSSRQAAYSAQARFNEEYPDIRTYVTYSEPNFKVHAGDFRTRLEAEKMLKEISSEFTSLFIITEKINPSKTDTPND